MTGMVAIISFLLLATSSLAGDTALSSRYTSIKESDCTKTISKPLSVYFDERGTSAVKCPSLKNWQPYLVSTNERSWIELGYGQSIWTTEGKVVYESIGDFPNIGADKIEWRLTKSGEPTAMIFRITAQDPNNVGHISRLYVISLTEHRPCFCGVAKTNEKARIVADNPDACIEMLPRRQLSKD